MLEVSIPKGVHVTGDSAQICLSFHVFTITTSADHCPVPRERERVGGFIKNTKIISPILHIGTHSLIL